MTQQDNTKECLVPRYPHKILISMKTYDETVMLLPSRQINNTVVRLFQVLFSVVNVLVNTSLTTGTDKCIKHLYSRVDSFLNTSGYVPQNKNYQTCCQCQGLINPVSYQSTEKIKIWGYIRVVNSINRHRIFIVQHPIIFLKFWILFVWYCSCFVYKTNHIPSQN